MGNQNQCNCFRNLDEEPTLKFPTQKFKNARNYNIKKENDYLQTETSLFKSPRYFSTETNENIMQTPREKQIEDYDINAIIKIQSTFRMYSFIKLYKTSLKKYLIQKENSLISDILNSYNTSAYDEITSLNPNYNNPLDLKEPELNLKTKLLIKKINGIDTIYIGNVDILNNKNGIGTLYTKNNIKYEGNFINNELNGYGRLTDLNNKFTLEGRFINSKLNGEGKKYSENYMYEGEFLQNQKNGKGKEETNEYIYIGDFLNDEKSGKGKVEYKNSKDKYEGDFMNNEISGEGNFEWENGHKYIGSFLNGKMHGEGKYYWPNGGFYVGNYIEGTKEGYGEMTWPNGKKFKGDFKNGKPCGIGLMTINGKEKTVAFKNGKMQRAIKEIKEIKEEE